MCKWLIRLRANFGVWEHCTDLIRTHWRILSIMIAIIYLAGVILRTLTLSNGRIREKHSSATPSDPQTPCRLIQGVFALRLFGLPLSACPPDSTCQTANASKPILETTSSYSFTLPLVSRPPFLAWFIQFIQTCTNPKKAWRRVKRSSVTRMLS